MTTFDKYCIKNFKVSPLHDSSLQSFLKNLCFTNSQESYEYIKNQAIMQFIERGIGGGIETHSHTE